jgi:hypothetical protein
VRLYGVVRGAVRLGAVVVRGAVRLYGVVRGAVGLGAVVVRGAVGLGAVVVRGAVGLGAVVVRGAVRLGAVVVRGAVGLGAVTEVCEGWGGAWRCATGGVVVRWLERPVCDPWETQFECCVLVCARSGPVVLVTIRPSSPATLFPLFLRSPVPSELCTPTTPTPYVRHTCPSPSPYCFPPRVCPATPSMSVPPTCMVLLLSALSSPPSP